MRRHCLGVLQRFEVRKLVSIEADVAQIEEICQHGGKTHLTAILNVLCVARDNWRVSEAIRCMRQHFLDGCPEGDAATRAVYHETFLYLLACDLTRRTA